MNIFFTTVIITLLTHFLFLCKYQAIAALQEIKVMESKHIVNVKIYGAYHKGHQQLTRIKENVTGSHGLETIEIDY